ncbi:MAG: SRPBCC domain-containing protein [Acidobacteria bacterium]|nr:SRPBCC domain-containing protein [Acidobacteriota bacterium]
MKSIKIIEVLIILLLILSGISTTEEVEQITFSVDIKAPVSEVWKAWTDSTEMAKFFTSHSKIEMKKGGAYELYMDMSGKEGLRGTEGCKVLSYLPGKMLSFEWSVPPSFGYLREKYAGQMWIVLFFDKVNDNTTHFTIYHLGFGTCEKWQEVKKYFMKAWPWVLDRLQKRFAEGPLDWDNRATQSKKK